MRRGEVYNERTFDLRFVGKVMTILSYQFKDSLSLLLCFQNRHFYLSFDALITNNYMLASGLAANIFMRKWRSWEVFQGTISQMPKHWFLSLTMLIVAFFCLAYYSETERNERDLQIHSPTKAKPLLKLMSLLGKPRVMSVIAILAIAN